MFAYNAMVEENSAIARQAGPMGILDQFMISKQVGPPQRFDHRPRPVQEKPMVCAF